jgi:hypothetical protein
MDDDRAHAQEDESQPNFGIVQERVRNFETKLIELVDTVKDTNRSVQKLADSMLDSAKPKWAVWIAAATLFCIVTGAMWTVAINPISEREIEEAAQERLDIQRLDSELRNKADSSSIEKTIDKLDLRIEQLNKNLGYKK